MRAASSGVKAPAFARHCQLPWPTPGVLIRASAPRPSQSDAGMTASLAQLERVPRSMPAAKPSVRFRPRYALALASSFLEAVASHSARVALSWVPG